MTSFWLKRDNCAVLHGKKSAFIVLNLIKRKFVSVLYLSFVASLLNPISWPILFKLLLPNSNIDADVVGCVARVTFRKHFFSCASDILPSLQDFCFVLWTRQRLRPPGGARLNLPVAAHAAGCLALYWKVLAEIWPTSKGKSLCTCHRREKQWHSSRMQCR